MNSANLIARTLINTLSLLASTPSQTVHWRVHLHGFVLTLVRREALSGQPC